MWGKSKSRETPERAVAVIHVGGDGSQGHGGSADRDKRKGHNYSRQ